MEEQKFIISIVTPSFNQGEFIEDTIKSILIQKGDFYVDYIVMDGGSKDQSVEIIKKYEELLKQNCTTKEVDGLLFYVAKDNDFKWNKCKGISYRWVSEKDGGQVNALKMGFEKSIGIWETWLNSDDYYLNESVFSLIKSTYFGAEKTMLITGDGILSDRKGKNIGIHSIGRVNLKELIYLDYHILQPATFFHRDIWEKHELNNFLIFDADFFISIFSDKTKFIKLQDKLAAFRMYGENITDNKKLKTRAFKEKIAIMKKYSDSRLNLFLGTIYQFLSIILKDKCEKYSFTRKIYSRLVNSYREFCYKKILNESYADRYISI
jgi:glycosyltransferase involved in cell wall biosynthesis